MDASESIAPSDWELNSLATCSSMRLPETVRYHAVGFNNSSMNQSGRVSPVAILAVLAIALFVFVIAFSKESLSTVGARFMGALARHDVDTLTELSYMGEKVTQDEIRKKWDFAVNEAGKYYRFRWVVVGSSEASQKDGSVRLQVTRNSDNQGGYEENFQLPMTKVGDKWKVYVPGISHEMFPGLPR